MTTEREFAARFRDGDDATLRDVYERYSGAVFTVAYSILRDRTRAAAAEGVVAYSAVCTHTGCEVGAFLDDEHALYCDCHQSKFNALDRGQVLDGPAPRPLPALPLRVVKGRLEVAGPFTARPGFEQG